jgi:hypothetical protein
VEQQEFEAGPDHRIVVYAPEDLGSEREHRTGCGSYR